ncbi:Chromosome segregation ATPase-like protein [Pseudomonas syringae pv. atrofaciens]|uniref:O-antigen chain-terminating methyltransferase n=3 Tax=Pseudomonas syringae TaxID=317 RepID=A0AB38BPD3_PSESX|nr:MULTISPECIES: class I SAM-dependent methyltransferase [Pseudomonas]KEZ67625.1 SAM-dependent methlyltransferase [Pseudomonas syringae pv. syringae FF5]AVX24464.1 methyltransferase domain-containing protein [Pseudomonas syringae pv. atrofaciens]KPW07905.1 Chromosome segregation ATPase-like protein [Pseudomonas syringae pv. atrofaciens]MBP1087354.1 O-antigen chain-terminating methyltransferase [Pseudomonas sp. PvP007]MBP1118742.1 O-antigen chain-terminating methyltransferase [Pseudomonas sp. P
MTVPFYRAFEDRYRGSRELIHERQQVYVPFLKPLHQLYPDGQALDLGCGRGEWLEILIQNGFQALGIDLDVGMLEACTALGLPVENVDALEKLRSLPDESMTVISGFHIAEHIPFGDLKVLVAEALRVLKPAGLLILETPNSENLVVGTQTFYLDPTHTCPIPHLLLSFLTEYSRFSRSQLLRLQEPVALSEGGPVDLFSVLHGVSPDYAIVAQKAAAPEQLEIFDAVFGKEYGMSLESLSRRYDSQVAGWVEKSDATCAELREQLNQVQQRGQELEQIVRALEESGTATETELREQLNQVQQRGQELEQIARTLEESGAATHAELRDQLSHVQEQGKHLESSVHALQNNDEVEARIREVTLRAELAESRVHSFQLGQEAAQLRMNESEARLNEAFSYLKELQAQVTQLQQDTGVTKVTDAVSAQARVDELQARLKESLDNAHHWWLKANENQVEQAQMHEIQAQLDQSLNNAHHWWLTATAYEARIAQFENSRSWRITRPLRTSASLSSKASRVPSSLFKRVVRSVLARSIRFVLNRPRLRTRLVNKAQAYPNFLNSVRQFALRHGIIQPRPHEVTPVTAATEATDDGFPTASPRVARVYSDLKLAFERKENR